MSNGKYHETIAREMEIYKTVENVHDLPEIHSYWANKFLLPKLEQFGYRSIQDFFLSHLTHERLSGEQLHIISIGAGNCDIEVELAKKLRDQYERHFRFHCLELNPYMLERGREIAEQEGLADKFTFSECDLNKWNPDSVFHVAIANHSLHHIVELEGLFEGVYDWMHPEGFFLINDMIGRNGHMRWPEADIIVRGLWRLLGESHKYNHQLEKLELDLENWDCSSEGFEGVRAQDILPLLVDRFHFELFIGFACLISVFVSRSFGHNFDPDKESDRSFIDMVNALDEQALESGLVKPTQIIAALSKKHNRARRYHRSLSPEFCIRWP